MPENLTKEDVSKAVADAISAYKAEEAKKKEAEDNKVVKRFTPGVGLDGKVEVTKDEGDQPFKNLGEQLQLISKAGSAGAVIKDMRLRRCVDGALDPVTKAPTGLGETVPSDGAFLVATEFIPTLLDRLYNTSIVYNRCAKQPVGANFNGFKIPAVDETSRADGSRWGGIRAYWGAEAATITASHPKFKQVQVQLQKLFALCYVTDEMLEDSVALEGYVNRWFPLEMGFKLDDAIINGDGAGKPLGILNAPGRVSVAAETNQIAATIVTNNVLKMYRRLWGPSLANAVWFINQDTLEQLFTLTIPIGTAGTLANLFQFPTGPGAAMQGGGQFGTMLTKPVFAIEQAATVGTEGDIILADLNQYLVGEKGGLNAASSIHVQFLTDQTCFRWIFRTNGEPIWSSALTPYKGSDTLSPYVTLATRS